MKSCIILGNGPSANNLPFNSYPTFGMNFCPIDPTYYICIDTNVLLGSWREIYPIAAKARIVYLSIFHLGSSPLYELPNVQIVEKDKRSFRGEAYMSGFTATYVALKMAYYLGFEEVNLWGVDHSPDWAHYKEDYPRGDVEHRAERMQMMEAHYRLAAKVYARAGRRIVNHSNPSRLDSIFERGK